MIRTSRREGPRGTGSSSRWSSHPARKEARVEKHEALGSAVAQIERQFGKGAIMRMGDSPPAEVAVVPTGALALDIALGIGGIARRPNVEAVGPERSGKTP